MSTTQFSSTNQLSPSLHSNATLNSVNPRLAAQQILRPQQLDPVQDVYTNAVLNYSYQLCRKISQCKSRFTALLEHTRFHNLSSCYWRRFRVFLYGILLVNQPMECCRSGTGLKVIDFLMLSYAECARLICFRRSLETDMTWSRGYDAIWFTYYRVLFW